MVSRKNGRETLPPIEPPHSNRSISGVCGDACAQLGFRAGFNNVRLRGLTTCRSTGRVAGMDERRTGAAILTSDETTARPWVSPCVATWFWYGFTYIPPAELEGWVSPMR